MFNKCLLVLLILVFSQVSAQCNNTEQIIESTLFGTIRLQSPGYNHKYERNLLCRWIINFYDNNSTAFIRAHFVGLLTTQDVVRIYTGPNETAHVAMDSSVNPSADRTVITTVSVATMMVVFVTDNHTENDGVGFDMKIMESIDLSGSGCVHNEILEAQDTIQYLTSPNFPDMYEKNSTCEWTLTTTSMSEVNVSIVFVNLDFVGSKCYHYLRLVGYGDFCKTFESDSTTDTYNYRASFINVKFHSDNVNAKTGSGFVIKYVKHNISIEDTTPQATTFVTTEKLPGVTTMLAAHHISTEEVTTYKTSKLHLVYNISTVLTNEATTIETNPTFGRTTAQSTARSSTNTQNPTAENENKYIITGTSSPAHTETKLSTVEQSTTEGESSKQSTHEQPSFKQTSIEHGTLEVSSFNTTTTEITTNTFKNSYVTSSSAREKTISEEFTKTSITTEQNTSEDLTEETIIKQTTTTQTTAVEITREQTTAERVMTEQPVTVAPTAHLHTDAFTTEPTTIRELSTGQTTKHGTFSDDNTTLEFTTERTTREEINSKQTTKAETTIEQTTTDKTSVKITVEQSTTSQMPTEQGTTAKITTEQTITANIKTEQTTRESTTKESTMATIANDQTSTTMTTEKASMNDTTSEQIMTEQTTTADITTKPTTPESTIKESTTMATITNDQTTRAMTTAPTTMNDNTSEQITKEGSVNKLKITGASTPVQTTTANITTDQTALKEVNTKRMTTEEDTVKETTSTTKTITTDDIHKQTIQSEITLAETTLEEITTAHTTPAGIQMEGTTVDITTDKSPTNLPINRTTSKQPKAADLTKVEVITLVTTVQTSIGNTTEFKTNQRTSEEATTKYASKEQVTKTEGAIIKTEQTTTVFITSEQTTTKTSTPEYTTINLSLAETSADHVTTEVFTADHKTASESITEPVTPGLTIRAENINQTIMQMPSDGVTTVTTTSSIETIKTEDETTIQITTIKQRTSGKLITEPHTTEQRKLKTTVTTLTTDFTNIQSTTTTSSYLNTFNPTTTLKDGNQKFFSDLSELNVSETSVVGIVVGGLVTMAILVVTLSVVIYAFVLKRYYSKNKLFGERYGIFPYRSSKSSADLTSNLPSDLTSNSSQNIIPKWVSMFDAFRMSGYNPTFQPPNDISQKVLKIPKWVQMMDAFEKSGHLQTFWEEVKHKEK